MKPVRVIIRKEEYLIKSEYAEKDIQRVVEFLNGKLREVEEKTGGLSEKKLFILAAMDIAGEYLQLLKERDEMLVDIRNRTKTLIEQIDLAAG